MRKIEIYDPAMCCSTGVCGTGVDPKLVQFASDLSWLKQQGVSIQRYNLAQQTAAFTANPLVAEALKNLGDACLPLVLVDGRIVTRSIYPTRDQLTALAGLKVESCCGKEEDESCCGADDSKSSCCCE